MQKIDLENQVAEIIKDRLHNASECYAAALDNYRETDADMQIQ